MKVTNLVIDLRYRSALEVWNATEKKSCLVVTTKGDGPHKETLLGKWPIRAFHYATKLIIEQVTNNNDV
jgi:hypothetical protein